jgi:hypothetical protein
VSRLPLLEEVELGWARWMEEKVQLLLSPPKLLKRVALVGCPGLRTKGWEAGASVSLLGI